MFEEGNDLAARYILHGAALFAKDRLFVDEVEPYYSARCVA